VRGCQDGNACKIFPSQAILLSYQKQLGERGRTSTRNPTLPSEGRTRGKNERASRNHAESRLLHPSRRTMGVVIKGRLCRDKGETKSDARSSCKKKNGWKKERGNGAQANSPSASAGEVERHKFRRLKGTLSGNGEGNKERHQRALIADGASALQNRPTEGGATSKRIWIYRLETKKEKTLLENEGGQSSSNFSKAQNPRGKKEKQVRPFRRCHISHPPSPRRKTGKLSYQWKKRKSRVQTILEHEDATRKVEKGIRDAQRHNRTQHSHTIQRRL